VAAALGALGLNEVLVEGGAALHGAWLRAGLYDRLEIYLSPLTLGGGIPPAAGPGVPRIADATAYRPEQPPRALGATWCLRLRRAGAGPASAP
jgi:diaminohydroxyphosphoribosylaminopyrimidine deaminase/5-amino-6-(5-phosphoribosylamino)uracil reductase